MIDKDALMYFSKVEKDDFERYIEHLNRDNTDDIVQRLEEKLENLSVRCGHLDRKIADLRGQLSWENSDEIFNRCMDVSKAMARLASDMALLPLEYGFRENENTRYTYLPVTEEKNVKFIREKDFLRIKLPELLPHRPQYDVSARKMKYYYDINSWRNNYYSAFQKEFASGKYRIYGEKVVFYFLHHVKRNGPDIDNLETKAIIDLITLFLLVDDDFKHVCHFMDMMEDETSFTEIIICPFRIFQDTVKDINRAADRHSHAFESQLIE